MRLALLTHEPFDPPTGGGSAEARYLVEELRHRGHAVQVFSPPGEARGDLERELGIRWHRFTRWRMGRYTRLRTLKYLLYPGALAHWATRELAASPVDGILAQHAISSVAAARLKRRMNVPVVLNFLDFLTGFMAAWPGWLMPKPALRRLNRYEIELPMRAAAEGVLTVSDPLANRFAAAGYARERLCPIYYGYDSKAFRFDAVAVAARASGPPVVVMHGSFDHHHLGPIAVEAMRRVHAARPEVRLRLIGRETPALRAFMGQAAAAGFRAMIDHREFVPYAQVASELAGCQVGIVPYQETPGTHCAFVAKAVEYLGLGLPVVSTSLEAIRLYFREEPLIRFAGFAGAPFAAAILSWLDQPVAERAALAPVAADRVARELDWRAIARRAVDFVELSLVPLSGPGQGGA